MTLLVLAPGSSDPRGSLRQLFNRGTSGHFLRLKFLAKYCKTCQQQSWIDKLVLNHTDGLNLELMSRIWQSSVPYKGKLFASCAYYCQAVPVVIKLDSKLDFYFEFECL